MANSNFRILTLDQLDGVSSVRNYIKNGNASQNTRLWTTYADLAGAAPVDGTGGSPVSTFTRSTISPLALDASFLWDKTAVNRQGEGFSYDFTIDSGLRGSQLAINHLLEVTSGTYVTGDMVCYIYDITNATLIQPSAYQVVSTGIAGPVQPMVFQAASNSTSYRLIFHTSAVSALAYSLKFDNFSVSSQIVPVGAAMSDWTTFVPTGTWAANTTWTGRFRRVGDSMELDVRALLSGAPVGGFTVNLPAGYTIDTAKLAAGANFSPYGVAYANDSGVANYTGTIIYSSTTAVQIVGDNGTAGTLYSATYPTTFGNLDSVTMRYTVPIVGWASNVISSDSAATRVVAVNGEGNPNNAISGTASSVTWAATPVLEDTHGAWVVANSNYLVKVPGFYRVKFSTEISQTTVLGSFVLAKIRKNTTVKSIGFDRAFGTGTTTQNCIVEAQFSCVAGDTINFQTAADGATPIYSASLAGTYFNIEMIQGPAQIQAATVVAASYQSSSGQSIANSTETTFTPATKLWDTTGSFNTATGEFTCPGPGKYAVKSSTVFAAYAGAGSNLMGVYKNAVLVKYGPYVIPHAATATWGQMACVDLDCITGDKIHVTIFQSSGAARTLIVNAAFNYLDISRNSGVN